ncbi:MAG: flagellar hook-length control protein FliK [Sporolactobacillus sp.]
MENHTVILSAAAAMAQQTKGSKRKSKNKFSFLQMIHEAGKQTKTKDQKADADGEDLKTQSQKKQKVAGSKKTIKLSDTAGVSVTANPVSAPPKSSEDQSLASDPADEQSPARLGKAEISAPLGEESKIVENPAAVHRAATHSEGTPSHREVRDTDVSSKLSKLLESQEESSGKKEGLTENPVPSNPPPAEMSKSIRERKIQQPENHLPTVRPSFSAAGTSTEFSVADVPLLSSNEMPVTPAAGRLDQVEGRSGARNAASLSSAPKRTNRSSVAVSFNVSSQTALHKRDQPLVTSLPGLTEEAISDSPADLKPTIKQQNRLDDRPLTEKADDVQTLHSENPKTKESQRAAGLAGQAPVAMKQMSTLALWKSFQAAPAKEGNTVADQVLDQMQTWMGKSSFSLEQNGVKSMTMTLYPEHLGQLTITVTQDKDGINAQLTAQTQAAKELLKSGIDQLQKDLSGQGLPVHHIDIARQIGEPTAQDAQQHYQGQQQSNQENARQQGQDQQNQQQSAIQKIVENVDGQSFKEIMSEGVATIGY